MSASSRRSSLSSSIDRPGDEVTKPISRCGNGMRKHARKESNPQPADLESAALPIGYSHRADIEPAGSERWPRAGQWVIGTCGPDTARVVVDRSHVVVPGSHED